MKKLCFDLLRDRCDALVSLRLSGFVDPTLDGAWDNSFSTRNNKWTYYGSRTSDGCAPAYVMLAGRNTAFMEAAR